MVQADTFELFRTRPKLGVMLSFLCIFALFFLASLSSSWSSASRSVVEESRQSRTLVQSLSTSTPWRRFYIALNLYNNADVIPSLAQRIPKLIREVLLPIGKGKLKRKESREGQAPPLVSVFISIFSNGSEDETDDLIKEVLLPALSSLEGVRVAVQTNGTCCGNHHQKPKDMDRIQWMACVREAALRPLRRLGLKLFSSHLQGAKKGLPGILSEEGPINLFEENHLASLESEASWDDASSTAVDSRGQKLTSPKENDSDLLVLFFNDIFFKPAQLAELVGTENGNFDLACGLDYYYTFYDTWVTRDISGRAFSPYPPYAVDAATIQLFSKNKPAQVKCCWNGLAAIKGSILINSWHPVEFRYNTSETKCYASECQLLCEDMLSQGHDRIYINPNFKVAYEERFFWMHQTNSLWFSAFNFFLSFLWKEPAPIEVTQDERGNPRFSEEGLQCVAPEDVKTKHWSFLDWPFLLVYVTVITYIVWKKYFFAFSPLAFLQNIGAKLLPSNWWKKRDRTSRSV